MLVNPYAIVIITIGIMAKEFIREIKGHKYKYLIYWDKAEKKSKQKYLGRVDIHNWKVSIHREQKKLKKAQYIVNTHLSF